MSKGCHRLIRDGARLVENVAQIMEELAPLAGQLAGQLRTELETPVEQNQLEFSEFDPQVEQDPDYRRLWSCLGFDPRPMDSIIDQSGLTARAVSAMLLMLELRGKAEAHPGGAWSRKK
jgi:DNA processing protein